MIFEIDDIFQICERLWLFDSLSQTRLGKTHKVFKTNVEFYASKFLHCSDSVG